MRAGRLVSILLTLQQRGRVTAGSLAEELEVSERTILRDMDELSGAGVPVYAVRGPGGGFELLDRPDDGLVAPSPHTSVDRSSARRRCRIWITPEGRRMAAVLQLVQPLRVSRTAETDDTGRLAASFRIRSRQAAIVELLSLGPHVEVVSPADIRDEIARLASATADQYAP